MASRKSHLRRAAAAFLLMGAAAPVAGQEIGPRASVGEGCALTKDNGYSFIDRSVGSCQDYYMPRHPCARKVDRPDVCRRQDMIKGVDWHGDDLIINTHRGVWGLQLSRGAVKDRNPAIQLCAEPIVICGPAENSILALRAARDAGFPSVEFDVATGIVFTKSASPVPLMTHLFDLFAFTDYEGPVRVPRKDGGGDGFINTPTLRASGMPDLLDRNRMLPPEGERTQLTDLDSFMSVVESEMPDMLVVLDFKAGKPLMQYQRDEEHKVKQMTIGFDLLDRESFNKEFKALLPMVAKIVRCRKMQANVIIKIPYEVYAKPGEIAETFGDGEYEDLLFAPQPDASGQEPMHHVIPWIEEWLPEGDSRKIAFWDTAIKPGAFWQGNTFAWARKSYADFMDLLKQRSWRRSAIWINDPAGPGGRNGNYAASWAFFSNGPEDQRGDALANLRLSGARHAVVTSDRPDLMIQVRKWVETVHPRPADQGAGR